MYSEDDLEAAVAAGVLDRASVERLRLYVAKESRTSAVDEEHFCLVTGFNDIFVSIAIVLLLVAIGWIGQSIPLGLPSRAPILGAALVATACWPLAELFTARRRMALPSILLLGGFVGGLFVAPAAAIDGLGAWYGRYDLFRGLGIALGGLTAGAGAWLHWRRFHVPITIAAGAGSIVALVLGLLSTIPGLDHYIAAPALIGGLAVFALAMRWDMTDPRRETRRADIAFWLHLLAAPLIVHPIFALMGLLDGQIGLGAAGVVILLYVAMGLVALAIDRRALLVSALAYVLYALSTLFREFGAVSLNTALTALVLGSALLMLSAYWANARAAVLALLPETLRARLPEPQIARQPAARPA